MKKIRWGIVGPGRIAKKFASAIKNVAEAELVAVASRSKERADIFATEFGIPETVLWATICTESDFVSNLVSDTGEIGLMQLSPERFQTIYTDILHESAPDSGMLYDPATNLRAGAALISELYRRYGVWETVYAAYYAGEAQVDLWLADPEIVNAQGRLENIPDKATAKYVKQMQKAVELYEKLYYNV